MSSASRRAFLMLLAGAGAAVPEYLLAGQFPPATVGVAYDASIAITGGTAPHAVDMPVGSIPAGLVLDLHPDGDKVRLHGTPLATPTITGVLPPYRAGVAYSATLYVFNVVDPVVVDLESGALPEWLTMTYDATARTITFAGMPPL